MDAFASPAIERSKPSSSGVQGPALRRVSVISSPSAVKEVFVCSLCKPPSEYCCCQHAGKNAKHGENVAIRHFPFVFGPNRTRANFILSVRARLRIAASVRLSGFIIAATLSPAAATACAQQVRTAPHVRFGLAIRQSLPRTTKYRPSGVTGCLRPAIR